MNKYENSKIYKIVNPNTDKIYIGSTCQKYLCNRFVGHKQDYKNFKSGKDRKHSNSTLIFDASDNIYDTKIILIEKFPCNSKEELQKREFEIITNTKNCVNSCNGKYINDIKKYQKEWIREYRKNNKEKVNQLNNERRAKNKDKINEKARLNIITCECGSVIRKDNLFRHCKTIKHQSFLINKV